MEGLLPVQISEPETPAWAAHAKSCVKAMDGIEDPTAFRAAVEELVHTRAGMNRHGELMAKIRAMLPKETT